MSEVTEAQIERMARNNYEVSPHSVVNGKWNSLPGSAKDMWRSQARLEFGVPNKADIDEIKRQWLADPCFDIEDTEGCEAHREELLAWRLGIEAEREREATEELAQRSKLRRKFGIERWKDAVMTAAIHRPDRDAVEMVDGVIAAINRALTEGTEAELRLVTKSASASSEATDIVEIPDMDTAAKYVGRVVTLGHRKPPAHPWPNWEATYEDGVCWAPRGGELSIDGDELQAGGSWRSITDDVVIRINPSESGDGS